MAARGSNKRAVVPVEGGTGAATRTGSTRHGLSRSALGRVLNLVDCIAPPPGVGQWSGLLEGGTWVTTGAALLGGARSLVGATDQTPVSSLLARVAECLWAAVLLGDTSGVGRPGGRWWGSSRGGGGGRGVGRGERGRCDLGAQPGKPRLQAQAQPVQLFVGHQPPGVQQVVEHLGNHLNLVRSLLEMANFPDDMSNHSHLGEVEQAFLGEVGRALLDEGEVRKVHAQVRDAGWVAAVEGVAHVTEPPVSRHQCLQLVNRLLRRL